MTSKSYDNHDIDNNIMSTVLQYLKFCFGIDYCGTQFMVSQ